MYFSVNDNFEIFFVSPLDAKHSIHILNNSTIAFSTAKYDNNNLSDRVGVQGTGECIRIKNPIDISKHLMSHYKFFPSWKESINLKNIVSKAIDSRPFIIKPSYIKFWNDALYGDDETEEFSFPLE